MRSRVIATLLIIGRLLERYEQTNSLQQRPKSGRTKSTTDRQNRKNVIDCQEKSIVISSCTKQRAVIGNRHKKSLLKTYETDFMMRDYN